MVRPALHGAIALLVLTAGCGTILDEPPTREDRAVTLLAESRAALDAVETYRQSGQLRVVASSGGETRRVEFRIDGAVNVTDRRAKTTAASPDRMLESYVIDDRVYRECSAMRGTWGVENASFEGDWVGETPAARQLSLLASGDLRVAGSGAVGGRNATVLEGHPSTEALTRYGEDGTNPVLGGPDVRGLTLRVWLDNRTARPLQTALDFEVIDGGGAAEASMTTRFHDYGAPVSIELPEGAREDVWETGCPGA